MTRRMLLMVAAIVYGIVLTVPASAQHFQQIPGRLMQIAAGRSEVWGLDFSNHVFRFNSGSKTFGQIGTIKLRQVAVGGGTLLQTDQVWGITSSGNIYRFVFKTNSFARVPGTLDQIVVGEGDRDNCHPYEVWGLSSELIYRYDFCGSQWIQIPGALRKIALGGGDVWGINSADHIYHYGVVLGFQQVGDTTFLDVTVGVNEVWGVDDSGGSGRLWRYSAQTGNFEWFATNMLFRGNAAGGNGFWVTDGNDHIFRYDPSDQGMHGMNGPDGQITPSQIVVGYGAGVWVIDYQHIYSFVRP